MASLKELQQIIRQNDKERVPTLQSGMIAGHLCRPLSPVISAWFIKKDVSPNKITLLMILFGVIGSFLFAVPNLYSKITGYICFYLWFTMDLCDGEVAHVTKQFSKYGREMDYMAHLICHPLMNMAMWITFYEMGRYDNFILTIAFIITISIELVLRNFTAFNAYCVSKNDHLSKSSNGYIRYFIRQSVLYPNFVLLFTPLIIIDYELSFSVWYVFLFYVLFMILFAVKTTWGYLRLFYNS